MISIAIIIISILLTAVSGFMVLAPEDTADCRLSRHHRRRNKILQYMFPNRYNACIFSRSEGNRCIFCTIIIWTRMRYLLIPNKVLMPQWTSSFNRYTSTTKPCIPIQLHTRKGELENVCDRFGMNLQLDWNVRKKKIAIIVSKYEVSYWRSNHRIQQ